MYPIASNRFSIFLREKISNAENRILFNSEPIIIYSFAHTIRNCHLQYQKMHAAALHAWGSRMCTQQPVHCFGAATTSAHFKLIPHSWHTRHIRSVRLPLWAVLAKLQALQIHDSSETSDADDGTQTIGRSGSNRLGSPLQQVAMPSGWIRTDEQSKGMQLRTSSILLCIHSQATAS